MNNKRNVVVHYHLFKNAGSSVDHLLKFNFGDKWMAYDGDSPGAIIPRQELEELIAANPDCQAVSSHQIVPPIPQIEGRVYPIVFLRDPIDRVKSAYLFEWKKQLGLDTPKGSLQEYIREKFRNKRQNSIEEFQTIRLSNTQIERFQDQNSLSDEKLLVNAKSFIGSLEFVGIVDDFQRSNDLLCEFLAPAFPDFKGREFKSNVLQDLSLTQSQKRASIKEEIGNELFEELLDRNKLDEALYQYGKTHFEYLWDQRGNMPNLKSA